MRLKALALAAGLLVAGPASADYMGDCDKLIAAWKTCVSAGGACAAQAKAIETQCKCHELKGDEWRLVMAAVGKDGVCRRRTPPTIELPPPSPPHPPSLQDPNPRGGGR